MSNNSSRSRTRVTPFPVSVTTPITLGSFQLKNPTTGVWSASGGPSTYKLNSLGFSGVRVEAVGDEIHDGPPYLSGGPFKRLKLDSCEPFVPVWGSGQYTRADDLYRYNGGFQMPRNSDFGVIPGFDPISAHLTTNSPFFPAVSDWGDKAWNKTKPKLEKAGAGVFLAEMRDLPRMMRTSAGAFHDAWKLTGGSGTSKIMSPKKAADHFLNHQFGWVPFLSDLRKFYGAFQNSDRIIRKLSDQNGQWVRRRVTLEASTITTPLSSGPCSFYWSTSMFHSPFAPRFMRGSSVPTQTLVEEVTSFITAVGKFRYYRPEFDRSLPDYSSVMGNLSRQATMYGLRISPSNIYKATPWTWAIDWVSNVGDYVDRVSDSLIDSVACQYLYLMRHTVRVRKLTVTLPFLSGDVSGSWSRIIETKQRDEASSPYGFNLSWGNLSPRQLAIAGALGISRFS